MEITKIIQWIDEDIEYQEEQIKGDYIRDMSINWRVVGMKSLKKKIQYAQKFPESTQDEPKHKCKECNHGEAWHNIDGFGHGKGCAVNDCYCKTFLEDTKSEPLKFRTTPEERKIIDKLDNYEIERWAEDKQFWKIYQVVIKATLEHHENNKWISCEDCVTKHNPMDCPKKDAQDTNSVPQKHDQKGCGKFPDCLHSSMDECLQDRQHAPGGQA